MGLVDQIVSLGELWLRVLAGLGMWMLMSALAVATHEMGHAVVGRLFGARGITLKVTPWGGQCCFPQTPAAQRLFAQPGFVMLLAVAGSVANIVAGSIAVLFIAAYGLPWSHPLTAYACLSLFFGIQLLLDRSVESDGQKFLRAWVQFCASCQVPIAGQDIEEFTPA